MDFLGEPIQRNFQKKRRKKGNAQHEKIPTIWFTVWDKQCVMHDLLAISMALILPGLFACSRCSLSAPCLKTFHANGMNKFSSVVMLAGLIEVSN